MPETVENQKAILNEFHDGLLMSLGNPIHDFYKFDVPTLREEPSWKKYFDFISGIDDRYRLTDLGICAYVDGFCLEFGSPSPATDPTGTVFREVNKRLSCHFFFIGNKLKLPVNRKWQKETIYGEFGNRSIFLEIGAVGIKEVWKNFNDFNLEKDLEKLGKNLEDWIEREIF